MRRLQRWWKGEAAPKAAVDAPPATQCQIDCSDVSSLHALVTRQAWITPDACALIHTEEGGSNMVPVSFAELEVRRAATRLVILTCVCLTQVQSNLVAQHLLALGTLAPGAAVGLSLPRSLLSTVAVLSVLKVKPSIRNAHSLVHSRSVLDRSPACTSLWTLRTRLSTRSTL